MSSAGCYDCTATHATADTVGCQVVTVRAVMLSSSGNSHGSPTLSFSLMLALLLAIHAKTAGCAWNLREATSAPAATHGRRLADASCKAGKRIIQSGQRAAGGSCRCCHGSTRRWPGCGRDRDPRAPGVLRWPGRSRRAAYGFAGSHASLLFRHCLLNEQVPHPRLLVDVIEVERVFAGHPAGL